MARNITEHIEKILRKSNYIISETPVYKNLMDGYSFDETPKVMSMEEANMQQQNTTPASSAPVTPPVSEPTTPPAASSAPVAPPVSSAPMPDTSTPQMGSQEPAPVPSIEPNPANDPLLQQTKKLELEKEVMRLQIEAMKQMNEKIKELEGTVESLNSQLSNFSAEVEKVKEPTDAEKFQNRKLDSHPFYFNLNDMWNDNTFQSRMDTMNSKGMVKTPDGGYIADFDKLPKLSQHELDNSFDNFNI